MHTTSMNHNRILVIDDEETNLDIIQEIFEDKGFAMKIASTGEEGLALADRQTPDVILLDVMMPGIDGYEVCRTLRQNRRYDYTKIIMLSGKAMAEERVKGYEQGADDYVTKPFINEELEAKVNVYMRLANIESDLAATNTSLERRVITQTQQLIESEKMASLGQLAAGVAHEINNPVGFITSNLKTLDEYVDIYKKIIRAFEQNDAHAANAIIEEEDFSFLASDSIDLIAQSIDGAQRVKEIVQGLKSFARVDESEQKEENVNNIIEQAIKLVWNELKYHCTIEKSLATLPNIQCHPNQLTQVFMNMLVNASHAVDKEGKIKITTAIENENIKISIQDNGSGIDTAHIEKLFDPFFTTKPVGKGTGLGLAISYGIVQKHQGKIELASKLGVGTTFDIYLPIDCELKNEE